MKRFESFMRDSSKVGKAAAISTIVVLFVLGNVSGVLGGFWRTLDNLTSNGISNTNLLQYGYGYGDLGWGYGYGYGFGSGSFDAGYYYDPIETGAAAYDNPRVVSISDLQYMSDITGTAPAASSVTITAVAQMQIAAGVTVTLPAGVVITDNAGGNFNFSNFTGATNGSVTDLTNKTGTPIDFGVAGESLNFSKPVKVEINVGTTNIVYPRVKHNGGTWGVDGLTLDPAATCSAGVATPTISLTQTVTPNSSNIITIYTCRASTFAASTPTSSGGGSSGGGSSSYTPPSTTSTGTTVVSSTGTTTTTSTDSSTTGTSDKAEDSDTGSAEAELTAETTSEASNTSLSDISKSFAKTYIEKLFSLGIVNGYSDGTFRPENKTTRAEYLKIVLKAMGQDYSSVDTSDCKFADVDKNTWVAKAVKKAASLGIISTENTNFRPNDSISRAEAIKMLLKAFAIDAPEAAKSSYSDVTGWAVKYVEKAKTIGIIAANPTFRPAESISRAEVSKIVVRTMDLK